MSLKRLRNCMVRLYDTPLAHHLRDHFSPVMIDMTYFVVNHCDPQNYRSKKITGNGTFRVVNHREPHQESDFVGMRPASKRESFEEIFRGLGSI